MNVGIIGLGQAGARIVQELLHKTAHDLFVYDPDGRRTDANTTACSSAAQVLDCCETVVLSFSRPGDLTTFCNTCAGFVRKGQLLIDVTDTSPALAHAVEKGMYRLGAHYVDCGLFGAPDLSGPFLLYAGGRLPSFVMAQPLLRCIAQEVFFMGAPGKGRAARMVCGALAADVHKSITSAQTLSSALGLEAYGFADTLAHFSKIARPFAELEGAPPVLPAEQLARDKKLAAHLRHRLDMHEPAGRQSNKSECTP